MQIQPFDDSEQFCDRVLPYLLGEEVKHSLLLRICRLIRKAEPASEPPLMCVVESSGEVVAVAVQTPPFPLVISQVADPQAVTAIAAYLSQIDANLPGVNAAVPEADAFAKAWQALTGQGYQLEMALRLHKLQAVRPVGFANGFLRAATSNDRDLLLKWYAAFMAEAMTTKALRSDEAERWFASQMQSGAIYLWQDQIPVSLACGFQASDRVVALNLVYTPPKYRNQGYATSCVAALSQHLLQQGYHYCSLFTDLANPISNRIYQSIGYQPVCDYQNYRFFGS